jgi:hypothetical protein
MTSFLEAQSEDAGLCALRESASNWTTEGASAAPAPNALRAIPVLASPSFIRKPLRWRPKSGSDDQGCRDQQQEIGGGGGGHKEEAWYRRGFLKNPKVVALIASKGEDLGRGSRWSSESWESLTFGPQTPSSYCSTDTDGPPLHLRSYGFDRCI